jgi:hypothetical protein
MLPNDFARRARLPCKKAAEPEYPRPEGAREHSPGFTLGGLFIATRPHKEHGGITRDAAAGMSREFGCKGRSHAGMGVS